MAVRANVSVPTLLLNAADDKWYEPSKDYSDTCTGSFCKQVLQFNSADERSNQVIREKIHQFVPKNRRHFL